MGEIGMAILRATGKRAIESLDPPTNDAKPADEPEAPAPAKQPDYALTFARACRAVRQCISLERAIIAETEALRRHARPPHDPRRPIAQQIITRFTEHMPDGAELRRDARERLEHELAADIARSIPTADMIAGICDDLGIDIDYGVIPDNLLDQVGPDDPGHPDCQPPLFPELWAPYLAPKAAGPPLARAA
jgi:hypothetical protein